MLRSTGRTGRSPLDDILRLMTDGGETRGYHIIAVYAIASRPIIIITIKARTYHPYYSGRPQQQQGAPIIHCASLAP